MAQACSGEKIQYEEESYMRVSAIRFPPQAEKPIFFVF